MSKIFVVLQKGDESRGIVEAIVGDNAAAELEEHPALYRVTAPGRMVIRRASIEDCLGRPFDLHELQLYLVSLSGHVDESDEEFILSWNA